MTAQYFAWWFALAPLCLVGADVRAAARSLAVWIAAQVHWLAWAWALEMRGNQVGWSPKRTLTHARTHTRVLALALALLAAAL